MNVRGAQNAPRPAGRAGVAADGSSLPPGDVYLTPYNPLTGVLYGPDGERYVIAPAGDPRLLGEQSWRRLFFGPLAGF